MCTANKCLGAIEVINKINDEKFDDADRIFLDAIASQAAIAIENAKLHERIVKMNGLQRSGKLFRDLLIV